MNRFDALFIKYGGLYGINAKVLKSIAIQESSLNPNAKALTSSALGLMQITKAAAQDIGENYDDQRNPETAIRSGAKYLRLQMDAHSFTLNQAIQAYYAGAGTIIKGNLGEPFTLPWQSAAYAFAKNVYEPKILKRANTLTV
jgi:soluble lytic murein transglycosylase-like protein